MTNQEIQDAVSRAEKGISQYLELMCLFPKVNVSENVDFQRKFNAFYRVQRRQRSWYEHYYSIMQESKKTKPVFADVLDKIHTKTGRYEPSFASKLVATIDPSKPIWDVHVLANTGHKAPSYSNKNKLELAKNAYTSIENWYSVFLLSDEGKLCISEFDRLVPTYKDCLTNLKKIDFILWQTRPKKTTLQAKAA